LQSAAVEGNGEKPSEFLDFARPIMTHAPFPESHLATISAGNDSARTSDMQADRYERHASPETPKKSDD
jgi:hypothetical protein